MHFILFYGSAGEVVYGSGGVTFHFEVSSSERPLLSLKDVATRPGSFSVHGLKKVGCSSQVIVCGVSPSVTLGAERRTENNQVLGNRCVNNVHSAHCT